MTFEVSSINGEPREWGEVGREMITYKLFGKLDGEACEVQINTTKAKKKVPFNGEKIECEVTKDDPKYGKTIKRVQAGGFTPGAPRQEDPERQISIIRQSSFERSILIQAKKADIFVAEKKYDEAHDAMAFKTIANLSDYIAEYAQGKLVQPKVEEPGGSDDAAQYMEEA